MYEYEGVVHDDDDDDVDVDDEMMPVFLICFSSASAHAAVSAENNQESNPNQRSQLEITARELIGLLQHPSFMILAFISGWASGKSFFAKVTR